MTIYFEEEGEITLPLKCREIAKKVVETALDVLNCPYEAQVSLLLTMNAQIQEMNPETGELALGDIVISKEKVIAQAEEYGHSLLREFAFLTVHSVLHLAGYDHMEEAGRRAMEAKQDEIMDVLKILR